MKKNILTAAKVLLMMTLLLGMIYPLLITGISLLIFPYQAGGSIIKVNQKIVGSELIGQKFITDKYFWSRPSVIDYNPYPSGASNLALTSKKLKEIYEKRKKIFAERNFIHDPAIIPNEMLFASGSGVDPHISTQSALLQVERVAKFRKFNKIQTEKLVKLIHKLTEKSQLYFLGDSIVNVLDLNMEMDRIK